MQSLLTLLFGLTLHVVRRQSSDRLESEVAPSSIIDQLANHSQLWEDDFTMYICICTIHTFVQVSTL